MMASIGSFIWFTVVVVGILVCSLAMISMGAACWDTCIEVPLIAQYLVITGSVFFCLLILHLLLTFCICTSSGEPKIIGPLKIVYGVSVVIMYTLVIIGTTILFLQSSKDHVCNKARTFDEEIVKKLFNVTALPPHQDEFCGNTLHIFSYSVIVVFNVLIFVSLLVTFYDTSTK